MRRSGDVAGLLSALRQQGNRPWQVQARWYAAEALEFSADPMAVDALIDSLSRDGDQARCFMSLLVVGRRQPALVVPRASSRLWDEAEAARLWMALLLWVLRVPVPAEPIRGLLDRPNTGVEIARVLWDQSGDDALVALAEALGSPVEGVRRIAWRRLHEVGDRAVPILIDLLSSQPPGLARRGATTILGHLKDSRAVPVLVAQLRAEQASLQVAAAHALGTIGDPRAVPALADLADRPAWVREAAIGALERLDTAASRAAIPRLRIDVEDLDD